LFVIVISLRQGALQHVPLYEINKFKSYIKKTTFGSNPIKRS